MTLDEAVRTSLGELQQSAFEERVADGPAAGARAGTSHPHSRRAASASARVEKTWRRRSLPTRASAMNEFLNRLTAATSSSVAQGQRSRVGTMPIPLERRACSPFCPGR
jgi:hypothetical protein